MGNLLQSTDEFCRNVGTSKRHDCSVGRTYDNISTNTACSTGRIIYESMAKPNQGQNQSYGHGDQQDAQHGTHRPMLNIGDNESDDHRHVSSRYSVAVWQIAAVSNMI